MNYVFRFKRRIFWRKRIVKGHRYEAQTDKMILFLPDGSIEEISEWDICDVKLGIDWMLAVKAEMEKNAGTTIPVEGLK